MKRDGVRIDTTSCAVTSTERLGRRALLRDRSAPRSNSSDSSKMPMKYGFSTDQRFSAERPMTIAERARVIGKTSSDGALSIPSGL
jgi:hypothetical protein